MLFSEHILNFYDSLSSEWRLPRGVSLIYPFDDPTVQGLMQAFYTKYYADESPRHFLFGINPGRFGAGQTGIPFTDPVHLESHCDIPNDIDKKHELSSIFIYKMIASLGGPNSFFSQFYITSLCPLGFIKEGRNYNYYDSKALYKTVKKQMVNAIETQISQLCNTDKAFSLGQGKNFKVFCELNEAFGWFEEVIPLPHPRWVMQYKRKHMEQYLMEYKVKLEG